MAPARRLFFALMPPPQVRARIEATCAQLQARLQPGGRATDPARFHVTLSFLGEFAADSGAAARARAAGGRVAEPAFELVFDSAGCFQGTRPPWVLLGRGARAACLPLHRALQGELRSDGFAAREDPEFTPHVTFVRHAERALASTPIDPIAWPVADFVLLDSHPAERRYDELGRWPLG